MVTNTATTRIFGSLKKKIIKDIVVSFAIGIPAAYAWWYTFHVDNQKKREAWYIAYAAKKGNEQWLENNSHE